MYSIVNGKLTTETSTPPQDNGAFRYGYGLFETMLMRNGTLQLAASHGERLGNSMRQLSLQLPKLCNWEYLVAEMMDLARRNRIENLCRIRLQIFAGGGGIYGKDRFKAGYIIECFPLEASVTELNANGLVAGMATGVAKSADSIANLKSCNSLIYAMAANQADANKWNDALIHNTTGNIIESTIANIFWVQNGRLHTPPLSEGCIAGIMRQFLIANAEVTETPLTLEILENADELWLTNAIRKIRWVQSVHGVASRYTNTLARATFARLFYNISS